MTLTSDVAQIPELVCVLRQKDVELSGNCRAADANDGKSSELLDGRIEGSTVRWQWKIVASDGASITISLSGALEAQATAMKGTFMVSSPGFTDQGSFTAAKQ
jgi:hypothetical protein